MFDELQSQFSTESGRLAFGEQIAALIRLRNFDQCEAILTGGLSVTDSALREVALATPLYHCDLIGWADFMKWVSLAMGTEAAVTAIGCGLNFSATASQSGGEPLLDVFWFTDRKFPFSRMPLDELQELCGVRGASWADYIEDSARKLRVTGLDALYNCLLPGVAHSPFGLDGDVPDADAVAWYLSCLLFGQRLHQLMHQAMGSEGSVDAVPMLFVGTPMLSIPEAVFAPSHAYNMPVEAPLAIDRHEVYDNKTYQPIASGNGTHSLRHKILAHVANDEPVVAPVKSSGFFGRLLKRA